MKWPVIALVAVGIIAAVSASAVVATFGSSKATAPTKFQIVVAASDLPAMTVVKADMLTTKTVLSTEAPEKFLTNPVQAVGRVLSIPVTKGQAVTHGTFSAEGSGIQLASALEDGMRAVSVSLMDYSGLYGLLYPGSVVDVMAYLKVRGKEQDSASVTIMKAVQVLGVEDQTVVSANKGEDPKSPEGSRGGSKRWMITLMVTPKQAQALQLAMENGRISLAMRNPLDTNSGEEAKSTYLSDILHEATKGRRGGWNLGKLFTRWGPTDADALHNSRRAVGSTAAVQARYARGQTRRAGNAAFHGKTWEVEVLRGGDSEKVYFPVKEPQAKTSKEVH